MERRNLDRLKLFYYLRVYDRTSQELKGSVVDISPKGMRLISDTEMKTDTIYFFKILLPEGSIFGDSMAIDARCRWCNEDHANKSFESGFEFVTTAGSSVYVVKALIEDLHKNNML